MGAALVAAPNLWRVALECRAPWEAGASLAALPLLRRVANGDGHSVIVFPGFLSGDLATMPLRGFLNDRGFEAHAWYSGFNLGPRKGVISRSVDHLREVQQRSGRKVSLVGWSLGGIYAREIAKIAPDCVRCVVTLGSPFAGPGRATNAWRLYQLINGAADIAEDRFLGLRVAPPVPTTSLLSKTDGVVAWQASMQQPGGDTENIEITSSHMGMAMNPLALYAVADRLMQPEDRWRRFDISGWRASFFKTPRFEAAGR